MLGLVAAGLAALQVVPAGVTDPPPVVSDVQVAWTAEGKVRVSWQEDGSLNANQVVLYSADNGNELATLGTTTADQPNTLDVAPGDIAAPGKLWIGVIAQGLPPQFSPVFDANRAAKPILDDVAIQSGGAVRVRWHAGPAPTDSTPGDPLDQAPSATPYRVVTGWATINQETWVYPWQAGTEFTIPYWQRPYPLWVEARNEWGIVRSGVAWAEQMQVTEVKIPARVAYGQPTVISAKVEKLARFCDPGPCWAAPVLDPSALVVLQARANASSPWGTVASKKATTNPVTFSIPAPGTRQYRIVVPTRNGPTGTVLGVTTSPVTTVTTARLLSAKFVDPTAVYGQKVTAVLRISPPAAVRTMLQRRDGTQWVNVKWVYLSSGSGSYTFTAVRRGTVAYRFVVPSFTYAGRPIAGIVTGAFTLTTR